MLHVLRTVLNASILCVVLFLAGNAHGQFVVNTTNDTPDNNPGDGVCADAGGNCSLRAAVMESNATAGNNTINLPTGNYVFTLAGANENVAATGDLDISDNLVITGADTRLTVIKADSLDRVFDIMPGVTVTIEFLEIWQGSVYAGNGGAIQNKGNLTLSELAIKTSMCEGDNGGLQGGGLGGAIYTSGSLELSQVTIHSCKALGGKGSNGVSPGGGSGGGGGPGLGGAIYNDLGGTCVLRNSTLSSNIAQGGKGGNGTFHQGSGTVSSPGGAGGGLGGNGGAVNSAGAAGNWGGGGGGGGSLSGAGAAGGFGGGGGGGGANSWGGNSGAPGAAGLYGGAGGQGCCSGGSGGGGGAGLGGGIFNRSGEVDLTNCTFAFNQAIAGIGGGGWFSGGGATGAGKGGAFFDLDGIVFVDNSLFAANTATTDGPALFGTFDSNAGHNLVQATDGGLILVGNTTNNQLSVDPLIIALANNGGNTDTHSMESCNPISPAIDAGNDAFASAFDQIGQARVNTSEIGSLEVVALTVSLLPADTTLCFGETLLLDVTSVNSTYLWSDNSTDATLLVDADGLYEVTISQDGCAYSDEILVDFNPLESVDLGADQSLCPGDVLVLDAGIAGAEYEWQDGATDQTYVVSSDGAYSVVVTLDDCSADDSIVINPVAPVNLDLGPDVALCEGESADLSTDIVADSYVWNTDEETSTITVSSSGEYTLEIEIGGCTYSASVMVDVAPNPTPNLGANMELCDGEVTTLDMSSEAGTYSWQDGSTAATFDVDQAGTYGVTVTQGNCQGYDEIDVIYHPIPIFDLGEDAVVCDNSGFQLEVITPVDDVIVSWNTGQNSTVITPNTSGTYQATVSANGCAYIDEIEIDIIESFSFDLGEDRILCKGSTLTLFTDLEDFPYPLVYEWSEGDTQPQIDVTQTGTYEVSVESECDLKTDEIHVLFEQCGCFIYVPNAFTPDQDGLNDYFSIDTQCQFEYFVLRIFNRDGSVIFESDEPTAIWGGAAYNGEYYVQNDVYVWQIEYISGTLEGVISETLSGFVTVVR